MNTRKTYFIEIIQIVISYMIIKGLQFMFFIYKGDEYFGVCYDNIEMAMYVCAIFEETLGYKFNIRKVPSYARA